MRYVTATMALVALMQGCTAQTPEHASFGLGDFMSSALKELPYDSPPQVIYQIDDHRFVTLERYRDCNHGETYYNDTRAGIRKHVGRGLFENFQGRIINADPSGMNIVLPLAYPDGLICGNGEKGCVVPFWYSTDGGKTFHSKVYMDHSFNAYEDSKRYTVAATQNKLFVAQVDYGDENGDPYVTEYPLVPDIDLSKPYPPGIHGSTFMASKRPGIFSKLKTPSGQDRIICNSSIKPTNPDAPLAPQ
ncbi:Lipoprotein [Paraburkholderia kururiensis]